MIKSHELTVGNILKKNGVIVVIDGRTIFDIWGFELNGVTETSYSKVPISKQVLFKLGYTDCPMRENHFIIEGHTIWLCDEMFLCDKNGVIIESAHQLQNLYFQLNKKRLVYEEN